MATQLWAIILVLFNSLFGAVGALFVKLGSDKFELNFRKILRNWKLILGGVIYIISGIVTIIAFRGGELSVLYPLVATVYIWTLIFSMVFLKEKMNIYKWLGIITIVLGVGLIGLGTVS